MADYGLLATGFVKMRLPEIRQAIIEDFKARLRENGLSDDIQTRPDSVLGLLIDTFADREASLWEVAEAVYNAMYPNTATGVSLDNAVGFTGVSRLQAKSASVTVIMYGAQGVYVPAGVEVRNSATQVVWQTATSINISAASAADVLISPTIIDNHTYQITLDGVAYSYHSGAATTMLNILQGLVAALSTAGYDVLTTGAAIRIVVKSAATMQVTLSDGLKFAEIGSPVTATPVDGVSDDAAAGYINEMVTLVDGVTRVSNTASIAGRDVETDEELRSRYALGVFTLGAATYDAILANVTDSIPAATDIKLFENDTDIEVDGLKPHSIKLVIDGGDDDDIAEVLYKYKAAGIDTSGDIEKTVQTDAGSHKIYFSRPDYQYIWLKAKITLLGGSEATFPSDGFEKIKENLLAIGNALQVGDDVLLQKFYCGVYKVAGVGEVDLSFASQSQLGTMPDGADYMSANISIGAFERAIFDATRIEVS